MSTPNEHCVLNYLLAAVPDMASLEGAINAYISATSVGISHLREHNDIKFLNLHVFSSISDKSMPVMSIDICRIDSQVYQPSFLPTWILTTRWTSNHDIIDM
jgi:hypothetical protein